MATLVEFYDSSETRDPDQREEQLMQRLRECFAQAIEASSYYANQFRDVAPEDLIDRSTLARVPVTRKAAFPELQSQEPPFGGLALKNLSEFRRVFVSPGPVCEPERLGADPWRLARALFAASLREGELVHNTFAYHFTPAGRMMESAAHALGCPVFAAGVGQSEMQARTIAALRPSFFAGTPSFLKIVLDKAQELSLDVSSMRTGMVSGEAFPRALRDDFQARGLSLLQCYATADVGLIGYESSSDSGLIIDEDIIVEIVRPGTGEPVAMGEVGEVVVTTLDADYPMLRLATGDLSAFMDGASPCGRTNSRIAGWMGRADQTAKVRGMFIQPKMVADVLERAPDALRARFRIGSVDHQDTLVLECEASTSSDALGELLANAVRDVTKLRADVTLCEPGTLPNDGLVIVDERSYD